MPSPHIAWERGIIAQGRRVTVRDETEKHGYSLVEGTSRAVARMNQREIAQAQIVSSNNATPRYRKARQNKSPSAYAAPVSCNMRASPHSHALRLRAPLRSAVMAGCLLFNLVSHAQTTLPTGFGPVTLGMHWDKVQKNANIVEQTRITSDWERDIYECGYRSAQLASNDARLLVTTEAFTVTTLSYVTAIEPGSDLMQVAQVVMQNYGRPLQATLRDALGTVTIDPAEANYVTLEYKGEEGRVKFIVSGTPIWEYRISIDAADLRRAQNRTIRCARGKEKERLEAAAVKSS